MTTIKKLLLLALTALVMVGCEESIETDYYTSEGLRVSIIDSCEYIHYSCGWGPEYTHKGNCRFCKERRQKELKELIEQLKEK